MDIINEKDLIDSMLILVLINYASRWDTYKWNLKNLISKI